MTQQEIAWAARHDWFIDGFDGAVLVRDEVWTDDDVIISERTFTDFNALKSWAGY